MWKKIVVGAVTSAILVSGCSKKEEENETTKVDDHVLTIVMEKEDNLDLQHVETVLEEKYGESVVIEQVNADTKRKMLLEGKADIALLSPEEVGFAKDEGAIQSINLSKEKYISSSLKALQYEGKQYAMPGLFKTPLFISNAKEIEKGESFEDLAKKAKKKEVAPTKEEGKESRVVQQMIEPYITYLNFKQYRQVESILNAYGYEPFQEKDGELNTKKVHVTNEEVKKGFREIEHLQNSVTSQEERNEEEVIQLFNEGKLFSFIGTKEQYEEIEGKAQVSVIPKLSSKVDYQAPIEVKGWVFSKDIKDKKIIQDFEEVMTEEDFVERQIQELGLYIPIPMTWEETDEWVKATYEQANKSYATPIMAEKRELNAPMMNALKWYLEGDLSLEEALKTAKQTVEFEIKSNY